MIKASSCTMFSPSASKASAAVCSFSARARVSGLVLTVRGVHIYLFFFYLPNFVGAVQARVCVMRDLFFSLEVEEVEGIKMRRRDGLSPRAGG